MPKIFQKFILQYFQNYLMKRQAWFSKPINIPPMSLKQSHYFIYSILFLIYIFSFFLLAKYSTLFIDS